MSTNPGFETVTSEDFELAIEHYCALYRTVHREEFVEPERLYAYSLDELHAKIDNLEEYRASCEFADWLGTEFV